MSSDPFDRLRDAKSKADTAEVNRANFLAYVRERVENGGWSEQDVAEYRAEVGRIMKCGTEDEKMAAAGFWEEKAGTNEDGINQRIRARIAQEKLAA